MTATQQVPRRDQIPVEQTWDLTSIYANDGLWHQDVARLEALATNAAALAGTIAQGAAALLQVLTMRDEVSQLLYRLYVYASMRKDSDSTDPAGQALDERAGSLVAQTIASLAFVEPEILALPETTIAEWQQHEPGLAIYAYDLEQLALQRNHIRSAEIEGLLAQFGDVTRAPGEIFEMLTNADLVFPSIADEHGEQVQLSHARYGRFLENQDRRLRRDAFKGMYSAIGSVRNTLATTLAAKVRSHALNARIRGYSSSLEAALQPNNIPIDVYHNLIATVEANLPLVHRYMAVRKRFMGLDDLRVYDLYAPLVPEVEQVVPYAEAAELCRAAFAPLGNDYAAALNQAFSSRWIDIYENAGKRSGAYSGGSYSTAPFILLNYQNRLDDMFTLAHELGHSLHSFFTRRTQPFVYGNYTTFVAEVASTLNEALLTTHLLATSDDPALRQRLVVRRLEDIRLTIVRQTMFAAFELDMHQQVEAGEPLIADTLSRRYGELVARYHGPEVTLDDEIHLEWARIPHFYYNFYVYQYSTGLAAALALRNQIVAEGQPAVERYIRFLSTGSSRSAIDMLRDAGVDMTTPAPIQQAFNTFAELLATLESGAAKRDS